MPSNRDELRWPAIRFNLLAKNIVSGVAVLLTPGLIFLVSLIALGRLYFRVENDPTKGNTSQSLHINWLAVGPALLLATVFGAGLTWFTIRFISRSITVSAQSATHSASSMSLGDFTLPACGVTNDELSDLAAVMNSTRDSIGVLLSDTSRVYGEVSVQEDSLRTAVDALRDSSEQVRAKVDVTSPRIRELNTVAQDLSQAASDVSKARESISSYATTSLEIGEKQLDELEEISQLIQDFQARSVEIAEVVAQIADIAEQTSLLALNATIESAKAGQVGAGFAVVASQIKELAVRTGQCAQSVTDASTQISEHCQRAVGLVESVSEKLHLINQAQSESSTAIAQQASVVAAMEQSCSATFECAKALSKEISDIEATSALSLESLGHIGEESAAVRKLITTVQSQIAGLQLPESLKEKA